MGTSVGMGNDDATVRFEPCGSFTAGPDPTAAACSACGWFEEEHWFAELDGTGTPGLAPREVVLSAGS